MPLCTVLLGFFFSLQLFYSVKSILGLWAVHRSMTEAEPAKD